MLRHPNATLLKQMPRTVSSARHHSEVCLPDIHLFNEVCDFFFGLLFAIAVTLLHQTSQFIEATTDAVKVIVGQFSQVCFALPRISFHLPVNTSRLKVTFMVISFIYLLHIQIRAQGRHQVSIIRFQKDDLRLKSLV